MFRDLYKQNAKTLVDLQEERRKKLLEEQKRKRLFLQDLQRNVDSTENRHEVKVQVKGFSARILKDSNGSEYNLQLSEWMRERPENLSDWVMVPCPKGQRCLLRASSGRTDMYSKAGRRCISFYSLLPGGNGQRGGKVSTLLDCVYSAEKDEFYVLDAIIYGNQELVHCESQFRFFWLRSKFDECESLCERSRFNEKPLKLLKRYDFDNIADVSESLQRFPLWPENQPVLDGWLFYHKESSYTCGSTPLVGWLFPFMIPDVLGMQVNESYHKPTDYTEPISYMNEFDAKLAHKKHKRNRKHYSSTDMDTLECLDNSEEEEKYKVETDNASLHTMIEAERGLELHEPIDQFLAYDVKPVD